MKPSLRIVQSEENNVQRLILASLKPLAPEIEPSPVFLQQTRRRLVLLGARAAQQPQAA